MGTPWALVGETLTLSGPARAAVVVRDEKIVDVVRDPISGDLPSDRREFAGLLCPGFIDLQINGAFGADVGCDPRTVATLSAKLPRTGVTSYLPTLISSPSELYEPFLAALEHDGPKPGARVLGAHLEGPFLAPSRKGAHDAANLRPVDTGFLRRLLGLGRVRVMTLAPELTRAREAIELLREEGTVASAGHTEATYEEVLAAVDAGLELGTHLYNAMSAMGHRAPGAVGALLASERVRVGVVPDGVHVHKGALRVAYRIKGPENLFLVTDAMAAAGMPPGDYELGGRRVRLVRRSGAPARRNARRQRADHGPGRAQRRQNAWHPDARRRPHGDRDARRRARDAGKRKDSARRGRGSCVAGAGWRRRGDRGGGCLRVPQGGGVLTTRMHEEIREQPEVLGRVLDEEWNPVLSAARVLRDEGVSLGDARRPRHLGQRRPLRQVPFRGYLGRAGRVGLSLGVHPVREQDEARRRAGDRH